MTGVIVVAAFIKDSPTSGAHATRDKVIGHVARAIYDDIHLRTTRYAGCHRTIRPRSSPAPAPPFVRFENYCRCVRRNARSDC